MEGRLAEGARGVARLLGRPMAFFSSHSGMSADGRGTRCGGIWRRVVVAGKRSAVMGCKAKHGHRQGELERSAQRKNIEGGVPY